MSITPQTKYQQFPVQEIPLAAVDLEDCALTGASPGNLERLTASIREVGLLAPPWLRRRSGGRFQPLAGYKRLLAVKQLGWEVVPARVLPGSTPESLGLLVSLYDNAFTRGFTLKEQAVFARRLVAFHDPETVAARYLPYLGLPPSPAHLDRLLKLAALEAPFQQLAAASRLALTAGAFLAEWGSADRAAALPFLETLPLSQSKQEEFLEAVDTLARREGSAPQAVLSREELQQFLSEAVGTPQARAEGMRRLLKRRLAPRFSAAQEAFQAALNRLGLKRHPRLRLMAPPAFEGPDFRLEINFRDAPELRELLSELARLTREEEFSELTRR
jgi:ParB-like chromosome segregation protein Spo0J